MKNPFGKSFSAEEIELFAFLKRMPIFSDLSNKELIHLVPFLYERNYDQNEVVFFRDDPAHALYIIRSGLITLNLDIDDKTEVLTQVSDNEMFGENSLLHETKRRVNAIVSSEICKMYVIPRDNLFSIMEDYPEIKVKLMTQLAYHYEQKLKRLFRNYRSSFGLFNIGDIYKTK